jgi:hypothetical protein
MLGWGTETVRKEMKMNGWLLALVIVGAVVVVVIGLIGLVLYILARGWVESDEEQ